MNEYLLERAAHTVIEARLRDAAHQPLRRRR